ncbi:MAG TPA: carbamate kinase [Jatrophihabitans sp.]|nr:carbamate kinase [Jatrophihabitans sp.]
MRIVVALGGNAMTGPDGAARPADQRAAIERAARPIADLVCQGHQVMLTHGNGPQVGNLLVKNELAAAVVPPVPLDWCGAQTQATIGVLLLNALDQALAERGSPVRTAVLVSRTSVELTDPAFHAPSKPIGRYLPAAEAAVMIGHGQHWQDRGERGWRRVVASPEPVSCLDAPAAMSLLAAGFVVVCAGGGGIPVAEIGSHRYQGVEAVIDKDRTAALLAAAVEADLLVIATDVEHASLGWATAAARPLHRIGVSELERHTAAGEFADGSMGPKVSAGCRFVRQRGKPAVITSLDALAAAIAGRTGTIIEPEPEPEPVASQPVPTEGEPVA